MKIITDTLSHIELQGPYFLRNSVLYAIEGQGRRVHRKPSGVIMLEEGMREQTVELRELASGTVSQIQAHNHSASTLYLPEGEICKAGYQDRVVVLACLVDKSSIKEIPVACVERDRWSSTSSSANFKDSAIAFPSFRESISRNVSRGKGDTSAISVDQKKIWNFVDKSLAALNIHSQTQSINDLYDQRADDIARYTGDISGNENTRGYVCITGKKMMLDLYRPDVFCKLHHKLMEGYVVESLIQGEVGAVDPGKDRLKEWLVGVSQESEVTRFGGIDLGENIKVENGSSFGTGLLLDGEIVNFSLYNNADREYRGQVYN